MFGSTHIGIVRHFQTVGHVAGEADIENSGLDAFVLDNIDHMAHQRSCLPGEGAAWLEDDLQPGIALVQSL